MFLNFLFFDDNYLNGIFERLSKWNVITGLVVAVLGFLFMIFCGKLTEAIFKNKSEEAKGKYKVRFKVLAMIIVLAGCCLVLLINN